MRKYPIGNGDIHHLMSKSIAGFQIFNHVADYRRMIHLIRYFALSMPPNKFSYFYARDPVVLENGFEAAVSDLADRGGTSVHIISYCIMPTHVHILAKQVEDDGIFHCLQKSFNAYTRYFNLKYKRKGPLWMGRFKNVLVENDEQLLHVTRYIHLNPTTSHLVKQPEQWPYSSYQEYVDRDSVAYPMTNYEGLFDMSADEYRAFCNDHIGQQRDLALIKNQVFE